MVVEMAYYLADKKGVSKAGSKVAMMVVMKVARKAVVMVAVKESRLAETLDRCWAASMAACWVVVSVTCSAGLLVAEWAWMKAASKE